MIIEFDWEVLEIINATDEGTTRRGARVSYTPVEAGLTTITKFVPVPWHKATDRAHAEEILERKVEAYAPNEVWGKELNPEPADKSTEIAAELEAGQKPRGQKRQPPEQPKDADTERGRDSASVPESR